jgi:hypothetical protein
MENKKAFYGTNVGKGVIDLREYPSAYQLRPTRIYLKENGAINDQPSFGILMEHPTQQVLGQLSLNMLNDGLNDVGYTIRKQSESVVIGEHIEGCNIRKLVDEDQDLVPNTWSVVDMKVIHCDKNGVNWNDGKIEEEGYAETWIEFPCFGKGCMCVKRVRIKAITQM